MKKTKIACSMGPSSAEVDVFVKMVKAGANIARINFSHATDEEKEKDVRVVKETNKQLNTHVAIMYDTKGPDFRTGEVKDGKINLVEGKSIRIVKEDIVGDETQITVNYKNALDSIKVNDIILLEDGLMKLLVTDKDNNGLTCQIVNGGELGNRKGINVPGVNLDVEFLSEQDKKDIIYACHHDGDFLALSFVSSREDILLVKKIISENNSNMKIISKIESATAIENIDEIIEESDGIMVARGDLGVEVAMKELPILQKMIIRKCREQGKFCIVATEMLASMYKNARPTRAEVSDIANAVLDGADAVMLSGETTIGKYPVEAVRIMAETAENTERYLDYNHQITPQKHNSIMNNIAASVVHVANNLGVDAILASTLSGKTARRISILRPNSIILAACTDEKTALSLAFNFGVYPTLVPVLKSTDEIIETAIEASKKELGLKSGDTVVVAGGFPLSNSTNFMKIEEI